MQKGFEVVNIHGTASAVIAVPTIGENGNWFIGNEDTGVAAQGPKGNPGPSGGGIGADGTPVGTVIAYMGTEAPQHFLVCDGSEIAIADFPYLSEQILHEFGTVNYFGGNGIDTFALPDLRNEFLRGYHGEAEQQLSGNIGQHQDATSAPIIQIWADAVGSIAYSGDKPAKHLYPRDVDNYSPTVQGCSFTNHIQRSASNNGDNYSGLGTTYTSRPTNITVLYCIKYEPA